MTNQIDKTSLWKPRSVDETKSIYADWADTYDDDVAALNYATPDRIATALRELEVPLAPPVLDFGCGTGLSGLALRKSGFGSVDGTDISEEMLAVAQRKTFEGGPAYRTLTLGDPDRLTLKTGQYDVIVATGVISLGAAPPQMLGVLLGLLDAGGLLAFSYNDPTLEDARYMDALQTALDEGIADVIFRQHGPHLSEQVTGSDVIVLRRL